MKEHLNNLITWLGFLINPYIRRLRRQIPKIIKNRPEVYHIIGRDSNGELIVSQQGIENPETNTILVWELTFETIQEDDFIEELVRHNCCRFIAYAHDNYYAISLFTKYYPNPRMKLKYKLTNY